MISFVNTNHKLEKFDENDSDRLKEFNQVNNRKVVKVLTLDDFDLKGKTVFCEWT